jgi:hypothetical protein
MHHIHSILTLSVLRKNIFMNLNPVPMVSNLKFSARKGSFTHKPPDPLIHVFHKRVHWYATNGLNVMCVQFHEIYNINIISIRL